MKPSQSFIDLHMPEICNRVRIENAKGFYLDGKWFGVNDTGFESNTPLDVPGSIKQLIEKLSYRLYIRLFCGLEEESENLPLLAERQQFMHRLSEVNKSTKIPDMDWQVVETDVYGLSHARKNGIKRAMLSDTFITQKERPGWVSFIRTGESRNKDPRFYYAQSDIYFNDDCEQLCFYWNLQPEGVFTLLEQLTQPLNFYNVPFRFKCLNHPALYARYDTAKLYINKQDLNLVGRLIDPIHEKIQAFLIDKIPLFTSRIYTGLSVSAMPANGQAYGKYMMTQVAQQLVAETLWGGAFEAKQTPAISMEKEPKKKNLRLILT